MRVVVGAHQLADGHAGSQRHDRVDDVDRADGGAGVACRVDGDHLERPGALQVRQRERQWRATRDSCAHAGGPGQRAGRRPAGLWKNEGEDRGQVGRRRTVLGQPDRLSRRRLVVHVAAVAVRPHVARSIGAADGEGVGALTHAAQILTVLAGRAGSEGLQHAAHRRGQLAGQRRACVSRQRPHRHRHRARVRRGRGRDPDPARREGVEHVGAPRGDRTDVAGGVGEPHLQHVAAVRSVG